MLFLTWYYGITKKKTTGIITCSHVAYLLKLPKILTFIKELPTDIRQLKKKFNIFYILYIKNKLYILKYNQP